MRRLAQAEKLIKSTKRKFIVFSLLGIFLVSTISFFAFKYHQRIIRHQELTQNLTQAISKQLLLIREIALLGESFDEVLSKSAENEIKTNFNSFIDRLNRENIRFNELLRKANYSSFKDLESIARESDLKGHVFEYMKRAKLLGDQRTDSIHEIREHIRFLNNNSKAGISDVFAFLNEMLQEKHKESIDQSDQMGLLLIALCLAEIFLVWFLVFQPLYNSIVSQHSKLKEAVIEIESANRSRSEFIANISHEIRTPMTGILGYANLLQNQSEVSEGQKVDALKIINQNAQHLLSLVDEILDISKIDSGKMTINKTQFDLSKLLSEVYSSLNVRAREKNLEFKFKNDGPFPRQVFNDSKRLKQILFNLLGNSIKFTRSGYIELGLSYDKTKNLIDIKVKDTGCGISEKNMQKLFRPFEQADNSITRSYGGTGLGLVLSKGLAQSMGGDVRIVRSKIGIGTVFNIQIDAGSIENNEFLTQLETGVIATPMQPNIDRKILQQTKILVVDDAKENARLFKVYLNSAGASVDVANSGNEALSLVQKTIYDAILLDIQMPEMDGYQVLDSLRTNHYESPVIALTAHAMPEEKEKTKQAGFNGHITKPVKADELVLSIHNILEI